MNDTWTVTTYQYEFTWPDPAGVGPTSKDDGNNISSKKYVVKVIHTDYDFVETSNVRASCCVAASGNKNTTTKEKDISGTGSSNNTSADARLGPTITTKTLKWNDEDNDQDGDDVDDDDDDDEDTHLVAVLKGALLKRPRHCFFEEADATSQELQELSVTFCESNGVATRVKHPQLDEEAIQGGGFLNIVSVEVNPSHRGQNLGLCFIHHVLWLLNLKQKWTLAVMVPCSLSRNWLHWKDNARLPARVAHSDLTEAELELNTKHSEAVMRHFARMGFVQAGSAPELVQSWFLTKNMYFRHDNGGSDYEDATVQQRWLSKDQANQLKIHRKPKVTTPTGLDKDLAELLKSECGYDNDAGAAAFGRSSTASSLPATLAQIRQLIRQGASIDKARGLHIAVLKNESSIFQELIRLGATVDLQDEYGNTALHVAASGSKSSNIECLLAAGADPKLLNLSQLTPLALYQSTLVGSEDFRAAFGMTNRPPRPMDVEPKLATLKALMSPDQRAALVDGWMSPRMRELLTITAEIDYDSCRERSEPGAEPGFHRGDYIPHQILKPHQKELFKGWTELWRAAWRVLRSGQAPTVGRIRDAVRGSRDFCKYELVGGRIEFMLDALLLITRNVIKDGDDGYEYETFRETVEALPENPLDEAFDVAFVMCIDKGGGQALESRGPYRDCFRIAYGMSDSEGEGSEVDAEQDELILGPDF